MISYSRFHAGARTGIARGGRIIRTPLAPPRAPRKARTVRRAARPKVRVARHKVRPAAVSAGFPVQVARFADDETSPEGDLPRS